MIYQIIMSFGSMMLLDVIWVLYTRAMMQHKAFVAGIWAAGITACLAVVTINYVDNPWMVIPTIAGSFCGTYIATKWED